MLSGAGTKKLNLLKTVEGDWYKKALITQYVSGASLFKVDLQCYTGLVQNNLVLLNMLGGAAIKNLFSLKMLGQVGTKKLF